MATVPKDIDGCQCLLDTGPVTASSPARVQDGGAPGEVKDTGAAAWLRGSQVCCAPLLRQPISAPQAEELARVLKALADPVRLRLVSMVAAHEGAEACVCELTEPLGLTQPTISHHLKVLVEAGILGRDKRGVWAYYALVPGALDAVSAVLGTGPTRAG